MIIHDNLNLFQSHFIKIKDDALAFARATLLVW
jgi:hypothetical protein